MNRAGVQFPDLPPSLHSRNPFPGIDEEADEQYANRQKATALFDKYVQTMLSNLQKAEKQLEREQKVVDAVNELREPQYQRHGAKHPDPCGHYNCTYHGLCAYVEFSHIIAIPELPYILESSGMEMIDFVEEQAFSIELRWGRKTTDADPTI